MESPQAGSGRPRLLLEEVAGLVGLERAAEPAVQGVQVRARLDQLTRPLVDVDAALLEDHEDVFGLAAGLAAGLASGLAFGAQHFCGGHVRLLSVWSQRRRQVAPLP